MDAPEKGDLSATPQLARRRVKASAFEWFCLAMTLAGVLFLGVLLAQIAYRGWGSLNWTFLTSFPSRIPEKAGILAGLAGTLWLISLTALLAIPVGVAAAVYLEEYARKSRINTFIEVNIANLAGVPSIVYGILGLAVFVRGLGVPGLGMGRTIIAGALTLTLLVLPVIIIAAREAIRAVPSSLREASYALGGTKWQTTWRVVLPAALPGILTGIILALSRAFGETAPLIIVGAATFSAFVPKSITDEFTALPVHVWTWSQRPQESFQNLAGAGIIVLLLVLVVMNSTAVWLRSRTRKG